MMSKRTLAPFTIPHSWDLRRGDAAPAAKGRRGRGRNLGFETIRQKWMADGFSALIPAGQAPGLLLCSKFARYWSEPRKCEVCQDRLINTGDHDTAVVKEDVWQMSKQETPLVRAERRSPREQILSILCRTKFLSTLRMARRYRWTEPRRLFTAAVAEARGGIGR